MSDEGYYVSTDKARLDMPWVIDQLKNSYWGKGLTAATVIRATDASICFGLYERDTNKQVGFARVVGDGVIFSSLMDVIISAPLRRKGLGKQLLRAVLKHPQVADTLNVLSTRDASTFYAKFGYAQIFAMQRNPTTNK